MEPISNESFFTAGFTAPCCLVTLVSEITPPPATPS